MAKKKYYQGPKDRKDESKGMKRYEEGRGKKGRMDSSYYGMLGEDRDAPANLPQEVVHEYYPRCDYMGRYELDDTIRSLDDTRDYDIRKVDERHSDSKW